MRKITGYLTIALVIAGLAFMVGCAPQGAAPAKEEVKAAALESAIVFKPGYYEDKDLGFSLVYDAKSLPVVLDPKKALNEVFSVAGTQKVPTITIGVVDITEGVTLENVAEKTLADFKKNYPDATRFKLVETKMVKLETGMDANASMIKWKWQGTVPLYTACVTAYKNGKSITANATSVPGQPPAEILTKMAMRLKVMP